MQQTLSRGQWGVTQDDAGRIYRNTNSAALYVDLRAGAVAAAATRICCARAAATSRSPTTVANAVYPLRPTRGVNRGYQDGILRAGRHARGLHRGRGADRLSRRSVAGRALRQRLHRRAVRQSGRAGSSSTTPAPVSKPTRAYEQRRVHRVDRRALPAGESVLRAGRHAVRRRHLPRHHPAPRLHHRVPARSHRRQQARAADRARPRSIAWCTRRRSVATRPASVEGHAGAARRSDCRIRTAGGATPRSGCWSSAARRACSRR